MRRNSLFLYSWVLVLGIGAAGATAALFTPENFTAIERRWQPAPSGHKPGADTGAGIGTHHPGENCGTCHRPGGKAEAYDFGMAGTLYQDRLGRGVVESGEVLLMDRDGKAISMTTNGAGNFWTFVRPASHPYSVSTYHGHAPFAPLYSEDEQGNLLEPADQEDSATWKYKTWVRNGTQVAPMLSIAGVGGGTTAPRMSCNMHHSGLGSRGALWGSGESTLRAYPAQGLSYKKHIFPILRSKCAPCHIPGTTLTSLASKAEYEHEKGSPGVPLLDYSGGLDLMTYEGSSVPAPVYDPETGKVVSTEPVDKMGVQAVVDPAAPESSPLLAKTNGTTSHGGGVFWTARDKDYEAIRQWVAEGAQKN